MPQTSAESIQLNDQIKKKTGVLMQCYDEIESILQLTKEKYDKAETENNNVVVEYHNKLKELNDKCNENKILQEKISELKILTETNEKIEQEIQSLNEVYVKNISEIHRLEEEKSNNSQISFSKPPLNLDLDDEFLGFDSVTISQSETQIGSHRYESYRSFYYKIKNDSMEVKNAIDSLLKIMNETYSSIEMEVHKLDTVRYQINQNSKIISEQFESIFQGDQDAFDDLVKRRRVWEEIKLNLVRHLDELESDMTRMGNRVKRPVRFPNNTTNHYNYSKSYLKNKLSIQQLFNIWSKLIEWTQHG